MCVVMIVVVVVVMMIVLLCMATSYTGDVLSVLSRIAKQEVPEMRA